MYEEINGIVRKNEYIFWKDVSVTYDYIFNFLYNKFQNAIIIPEFDNVDLFIIDENLPVEIQSTTIHSRDSLPVHSQFEDKIQRQLTQNIVNYGRCWFFFDENYLKYFQNDIAKNSSINLDWFYKFIKDDKLTVFTCSYDGNIIERTIKDFGFIARYSNTCKLAEESDSRILTRNKAKIIKNVFNYYGITTQEIIDIRHSFKERNRDKDPSYLVSWLLRKERNVREKNIGNIYMAMHSLDTINAGFGCNIDNPSDDVSHYLNILGLIERIEGNNQNATRRFTNKMDIAKYFPEYIRNKEKWDFLIDSKTKINIRQYSAILSGKINPLDWKRLIYGGW